MNQKISTQNCKGRGAEKKDSTPTWKKLREGVCLERSKKQLGRNEDLEETECL